MAVYLTPSELLNYYDQRRVLELTSDTSVPTVVGVLSSNAIALTAIRMASAELDSHLQTGRRYERSQLEDLITAANAGGATETDKKRAEPIKELVAHLAFGRLMSRRGYNADKMRQLAPMFEDAQQKLNLLASGVRVFDIDANKSAGVPTAVTLGRQRLMWSQYSRMFGVFPTGPLSNSYASPSPGGY